jgi:cobalt-zinc-cadmium efflux system protein
MGSGHEHAHAADLDHRGRLTAVLAITVVTFALQLVGAMMTRSLALVADAGHLLTDVMGLSMAMVAASLAQRAASHRRTWGFKRAEVLAAAAQAVVLSAVACYVIVEGIRRLISPPEVASDTMIVFGLLGLVGNAAAIAVLSSSRSANLNTRAAFLEVVNDALGSVAVVVAAIVITTTGWLRADAVVSLLIGVLILPRALVILKEASAVLLESTPKGLDLVQVRQHILGTTHVHDVHDLHATQIATGLPVLTAHVVVDDSCFLDGHLPELLHQLQRCVADHFPVSVEHSTFQFEPVSHVLHEARTHA